MDSLEPGAEALARAIVTGLPGAVATIERVQGRPFKRASVYAFASSNSFTVYGAAGGRERGTSWGRRVYRPSRARPRSHGVSLMNGRTRTGHNG
jgi:hypothetical protein